MATTDKYKDILEKEAKSNSITFYQENRDVKFSNYEYGFIEGIHSELNNRIIEIEKRMFAVEVLNNICAFANDIISIKAIGKKIKALQS